MIKDDAVRCDGSYGMFPLETPDGKVLRLRLSCLSDGTWRVQGTAGEEFDPWGAAQVLARDLGEPLEEPYCTISMTQSGAGVWRFVSEAGTGAVLYEKPFRLGFYNGKAGDGLTKEPEGKGAGRTMGQAAGKDGGVGTEKAVINRLSLRNGCLNLSGSLTPEEHLFGTGQRFNRVNQRGKTCETWAIDRWCQTEGNSYVPVPFIMSTRGYGLFFNRFEYSTLDLGAAVSGQWSYRVTGAPLDLYVFLHDDPKKILESYSRLTGFAPEPAEWMYGILVCRHARLKEFGSVEGIMAMADKMAEADLPWDAVIIEGWEAYDPKTYGDMKEVVSRLHAAGKKVLVYQPCGRLFHLVSSEEGAYYHEAWDSRKEWFVRNQKTGETWLPEATSYNPADSPDTRYAEYVDLTHPEARDWWFDKIWRKLICDIGIDGAKIDFCEQFPESAGIGFHDGRNTAGAHHWYPVLYNTLMHRYYNKHRPEGGMCFSRGGGIGAQRYPFLWAGDQLREWRFLQAILKAVLSSGLSGLPFMSHDLAGYLPSADPDHNTESKVFLRGAQMACFGPNMQTHGTVTRPYDFDEPTRRVYRAYCRIHNALKPYLVEQGRISCATGVPLMRHLYLSDPGDPNVQDIEDQYMLGDALLVAPVLEDAEVRDVYLPMGEWRYLPDGSVHHGGQLLKNLPVPLHRIPVFLKEGHDSRAIGEAADRIREILRESEGME